MERLLHLVLIATLLLGLTACTGSTGTRIEEHPASEVKVGAILIHDENSGYDMAHIQGLSRACRLLEIPPEHVMLRYNVAESSEVSASVKSLAAEGCDIIFSDSYGHQHYMEHAAAAYPELTFVSCTGNQAAASGLKNLKNIFPYTYESRYVSGVVAGMKLRELLQLGVIHDPYVGYVGAYPYDEVVSGYTAFFLGVRSVVPQAHMDVCYTNTWYDPVREAQAAAELLDRGCVIIGQHADSTGASAQVQAAYEDGRQVFAVGYNVDMLAVAPDAALTSAQNVWSVLYYEALSRFVAGEELPSDLAGGIAMGAQTISTLGPNVAPGTAQTVERVWESLKNGTLHVFDTDTFRCEPGSYYEVDDTGKVLSAYALDTDGDGVPDQGEAIVEDYFAESVLRSAPYFHLRIKGITELN